MLRNERQHLEALEATVGHKKFGRRVGEEAGLGHPGQEANVRVGELKSGAILLLVSQRVMGTLGGVPLKAQMIR